MYLERAALERITPAHVEKITAKYRDPARYGRLQSYYVGEHGILLHQPKDTTLPNNHLVSNIAKYITDINVGYFIGQPVVYSSRNPEMMEALQDIFDYNDEQDHNSELGKKCSIFGHCYEMLYIDEDAQIRFAIVEPDNLVLIYESGYTNPIGAVRRTVSKDLDDNVTTRLEFWNWWEVWRFSSYNNGGLQLESMEEHYWNDVPFVEYVNNDDRLGDFEGIISLNDAYNTVQSNTANMFQYNDEAILTVEGIGEVTSEDIRDMKQKGAIILEGGGKIEWLLKVINDSALENYKDRLFSNMHQLSNVPNMADESFSNNLSGVAMDYKLWGLEQNRAIKARKFKKGLQRRVELIVRMLNIMGARFDYRELEMHFRANKPQNVYELAQIFVMLVGEVSKETRLKMLPMIESVQDELEKLMREKKEELADFGNYDALLQSLEELKHVDDEPAAELAPQAVVPEVPDGTK